MADLHHNIFGYYRGPPVRERTQGDAVHAQIEDNSTKAVVNVLEHSELGVLVSFLARFVPGLPAGARPPRFHLQRGPTSIPPPPRFLLGISVLGEIDTSGGSSSTGSRVDAFIEPADGGMVAIEVKTVGRLDAAQLRRHAERWGIATAAPNEEELPPGWLLTRWADIWAWARHTRSETNDPVARFLLSQLTDYLERVGLAPWSGFLEEDFVFFAARTNERHAVLRNRMAGLWPRVLDMLPAADRGRLGTVAVGRLGADDDHVWAQTNRGEDVVNLSAELYGHELQLNVVGWRRAPAARLDAALRRADLPSLPVELIVFARIPTVTDTGRPNWRTARYEEVLVLSDAELRRGDYPFWRESWREPGGALLAFHLRRAWSRNEVLGRGDRIVGELAETVVQLMPWLRGVNRWT